MNIPKVENMVNNRTGKPVANQFIISINSVGTFYQSYKTIICAKTLEGTFLNKAIVGFRDLKGDWKEKEAYKASNTTLAYLYQFLGTNKKELQELIDNGTYQLVEL